MRLYLPALLLALTCTSVASAQPPERDVLTPEEAVELAVRHSPAFAEVGLSLEEAKAELRAQQGLRPWTFGADVGALWEQQPTSGVIEAGVRSTTNFTGSLELLKQFVWGTQLAFTLDLNRTRVESPFQVPDLGIDEIRIIGPNYGSTASVSLSQPLLRGFGRELGDLPVTAAERRVDAAEAQLARARADLVVEVIEAYWGWVRAAEELEARRASMARTEALADATIAQIEAGQLAELERNLVEQRIAASAQAILLAEAQLADAADALRNTIGVPIEPPAESMGTAGFHPPARLPVDVGEVPELDVLVEAALAKNPDVALLDAEIAAAELELVRGRDAVKPQLDATARLSQLALSEEVPAALEQLATLDYTGVLVGLVFRIPFDNSLAEEQLEAAEVAVQRARLRREQATRQIRTAVRQARRLLAVQRERVDLARTEVRLATQNLQAMREKFSAGLASNLEVLELESDLEDAELRLRQALIDTLQARVRLGRLTGM